MTGRRLLFSLRSVAYGWAAALRQLIAILREIWSGRVRLRDGRTGRASRATCEPIDHPAFVRPDPLIYDQYYLSKLGFPVVWDNPDIQLYREGLPVPSSTLDSDTQYEIVARIWNASPDAPVVQMPVHFSYLDFGIGNVSVPIGSTKVTIGVKGSQSQPGYARIGWRTPSVPGHYCIQVLLDPVDDSNYANNLGQENTNVGRAGSPATFDFKLRNSTRHQNRYRFTVDAYELPPQPPCDGRSGEIDTHLREYLLPAGWQISISPEAPSLLPGVEIDIHATVTPPAGWTGSQTINVNAYDDDDSLAGGVTLTVAR